jgi:hypothetical protein
VSQHKGFSRYVSRGTALLATFSLLALGSLSPAAAADRGASVAAHPAEVTKANSTVIGSQTELPPYAIRIVPGSVIHLVSRSSKLPVSIRNDYPVEMRVQVHVAPTNLDAIIPAAIEVVVPANTTYVAKVPVTAIADGEVPLNAWLSTFSGLEIGPPVRIDLTVNAEVEDSLLAGFAAIVAGLGVAGIIRTLAKRRKLRANAEEA